MAQITKEQIQNSILGIIEDQYVGGVTAYLEECEAKGVIRQFLGLSKTKCPHQMITIALPENYDQSMIHHKMMGIAYHRRTGAPKTWFNGIASVEYYSKTHPEGGNLHIHILKKGNYTKSKIIRDLSGYYGIQENFIDVKLGTYLEDYENRHNYILGQKQSKEKLEYTMLDKKWRSDNNIMDIYEY